MLRWDDHVWLVLFDDAGLPVREIERHTDVADGLLHALVEVGVPAEEAQALAEELGRAAEAEPAERSARGRWTAVVVGLVLLPWLLGVVAVIAAVAYGVMLLL